MAPGYCHGWSNARTVKQNSGRTPQHARNLVASKLRSSIDACVGTSRPRDYIRHVELVLDHNGCINSEKRPPNPQGCRNFLFNGFNDRPGQYAKIGMMTSGTDNMNSTTACQKTFDMQSPTAACLTPLVPSQGFTRLAVATANDRKNSTNRPSFSTI